MNISEYKVPDRKITIFYKFLVSKWVRPKKRRHCLCASIVYITDGRSTGQLELINIDAHNFHNCVACRAALRISGFNTIIEMMPIQEFYAELAQFSTGKFNRYSRDHHLTATTFDQSCKIGYPNAFPPNPTSKIKIEILKIS